MSILEKDKYLHNLFLTISNPDVYQVGVTEDILEDTRRNTPSPDAAGHGVGNRYLTWRSEWGFEVFEYYEKQPGSTLPKVYRDGLNNPLINIENNFISAMTDLNFWSEYGELKQELMNSFFYWVPEFNRVGTLPTFKNIIQPLRKQGNGKPDIPSDDKEGSIVTIWTLANEPTNPGWEWLQEVPNVFPGDLTIDRIKEHVDTLPKNYFGWQGYFFPYDEEIRTFNSEKFKNIREWKEDLDTRYPLINKGIREPKEKPP